MSSADDGGSSGTAPSSTSTGQDPSSSADASSTAAEVSSSTGEGSSSSGSPIIDPPGPNHAWAADSINLYSIDLDTGASRSIDTLYFRGVARGGQYAWASTEGDRGTVRYDRQGQELDAIGAGKVAHAMPDYFLLFDGAEGYVRANFDGSRAQVEGLPSGVSISAYRLSDDGALVFWCDEDLVEGPTFRRAQVEQAAFEVEQSVALGVDVCPSALFSNRQGTWFLAWAPGVLAPEASLMTIDPSMQPSALVNVADGVWESAFNVPIQGPDDSVLFVRDEYSAYHVDGDGEVTIMGNDAFVFAGRVAERFEGADLARLSDNGRSIEIGSFAGLDQHTVVDLDVWLGADRYLIAFEYGE